VTFPPRSSRNAHISWRQSPVKTVGPNSLPGWAMSPWISLTARVAASLTLESSFLRFLTLPPKRAPNSCLIAWGQQLLRQPCAPKSHSLLRIPLFEMLTSPCWQHAFEPKIWSMSCPRSPISPRNYSRSKRGVGPPTMWPCGSSAKTRGSAWPPCAQVCPTSPFRCCCEGETPLVIRPIPLKWRMHSSKKRVTPVSIFSEFLMHWTMSAICDPQLTRYWEQDPLLQRWACVTAATSLIQLKTCTRWTTTSRSPKRLSKPARTSWPLRTWRDYYDPRPRSPWWRRCGSDLRFPSTSTPTTRRVASSRLWWPPPEQGWTPWMLQAHLWREQRASRPCRLW